ncbi:MAG: MFS transporter, partial [Hydrogenophaga sp.]
AGGRAVPGALAGVRIAGGRWRLLDGGDDHLQHRHARQRAAFWRIYHDLGDPSRYVERFIVASWADDLHQRARATMADKELENGLLAFLQPGTSVVLQHYIAER